MIQLDSKTEELVRAELLNGNFQTVDEMIVEGVRARREVRAISNQTIGRSRAEAVAHIRQMRRGNHLPAGVTIRDLINEGRA